VSADVAAPFVKYSVEKLRQLAGRIENCLGRLSEEQVWTRGSENENAVGNLVLHLCGNVGQWIGTGVAGRPDQRQRDAEFNARDSVSIPELKQRLRSAVEDAAAIIDRLTADDLARQTRVQKYDVTSLEAVYHVVAHFSEHTGQILFATKLLTGQDLGYYGHLKAAAHAETTP